MTMPASWNDVIVSEFSSEPRLQGGFPKIVRQYQVTSQSTKTVASSNRQVYQTWKEWIQLHFIHAPLTIAKDLFLPVG